MTSDILQQHRNNLNNQELIITPQILNKALILVEDQFLKISGKMLSTLIWNFLRGLTNMTDNLFKTDIILQKQRIMTTNF